MAQNESQIAEILRRLDAVEARLGALEGARHPSRDGALEQQREPVAAGSGLDVDDANQDVAVPDLSGFPNLLPFVGRMLLVFAGAYLIRAVTEAGALPQLVGTFIGIFYAAAWLVFLQRAAHRGRRGDAAFYGIAFTLVFFPLLWETTYRFGFISADVAALTVLLAAGGAFYLAWRWRMRALGWLFSVATGLLLVGLGFGTKQPVPFLGCLVVFGLISLWIGYAAQWPGIAVLFALFVNGSVALATLIAIVKPHAAIADNLGLVPLLAIQFMMAGVYFGSFGVRTLLNRRNITWPEIVQASAAFLIGLGGSVAFAVSHKVDTVPIGLVTVLFALANYAIAFAFVDRRTGRGRNFFFYTTLALLLALVGLPLMLGGGWLLAALAGLVLVSVAVGHHFERATLGLHGALYLLAASVVSGATPYAVQAFLGGVVQPRVWVEPAVLVCIAVAAACYMTPTHQRMGKLWTLLTRTARIIYLAVLVAGVAGALFSVIPSLFQGLRGDVGALAAMRSGVLALATLFLAWVSRQPRFIEAGLFVYPLLAIGGVKLVVDDFRLGRPATLFLSLALYGIALIVAPRIKRN